ncbi:MAG: hypothetical protein HFJ30_00615 [Clostridia bacterium]|mgnify:CR=1 FL=1|jgi:hypothetical protein|nr:hypothetical protein [Clostridia bacterium]
MEEKLLKIFKLANLLNAKQEKVYAQITYIANDDQTLELSIRLKKDYSYIQQCKVELSKEALISLDNIIELFEKYAGGAMNE